VTGSEWMLTTNRLYEALQRNTTLQFGPIELVYYEEGQDVALYGPTWELRRPGLWVILPAFCFEAADGIPTMRTGQFVFVAECAGARAAFDGLVQAFAKSDVLAIVERPRVGAAVIVREPPGSAETHLEGKRGSIVEIDPLPEHEGGEFWRVQITDGPEVQWHRDCFVLDPAWRISSKSSVVLHYDAVAYGA
jgi:hypothetical protein